MPTTKKPTGLRGFIGRLTKGFMHEHDDVPNEAEADAPAKKSRKSTTKIAKKKPMEQKVFAITIHKGGVGKTTTTANLAGALAEIGYKVLLIDCDSQGDLSGIFIDDHEQLPHNVADIFGRTGIELSKLIKKTSLHNISIITADRRLEAFEKTNAFFNDPNIAALQDAIAQVKDKYDFVLIDCATRPHLTGYAALVAADELIVPLEGSQFSFRSVASIRDQVEQASTQLNPDLKVRYFLSRAKRTKMNELYRSTLIEVLGEQAVLQTEIPEMATMTSAINLRKPIVHHSKNSKAAQSVRDLVSELI